jgi:hypothetical protein
MLSAKEKVKPASGHFSSQLAAFPDTKQWLLIVGVSENVAKVKHGVLE